MWRIWTIVAVGLVLISSGMTAQQSQIGLPIGATPEPVTIEDLDGAPVDLRTFLEAKPVVIEFWATWCPLCKALLPQMADASRHYGDRVQFLAIAVAVNQTQRSIRRHLDKHPLPFPVLWDAGGRAVRAFMTPTTSYVVVLDARGQVAYTGTGDEQDIGAAIEQALGTERP